MVNKAIDDGYEFNPRMARLLPAIIEKQLAREDLTARDVARLVETYHKLVAYNAEQQQGSSGSEPVSVDIRIGVDDIANRIAARRALEDSSDFVERGAD